jgi:hypothetical protein
MARPLNPCGSIFNCNTVCFAHPVCYKFAVEWALPGWRIALQPPYTLTQVSRLGGLTELDVFTLSLHHGRVAACRPYVIGPMPRPNPSQQVSKISKMKTSSILMKIIGKMTKMRIMEIMKIINGYFQKVL